MTRSTGKRAKYKSDHTGLRYGRLLVLRRVERRVYPSGSTQQQYLCRCDCGTEKVFLITSLQSGNSKSCGCLKNELLSATKRKRPFEARYNVLRHVSERDGKSCSLSYEEFLAFTKIRECHYCGSPIPWGPHFTPSSRGGYYLDRKDSSIGYTKDNCVVCCTRCNQSKSNSFAYEEWCCVGEAIRSYREQLGVSSTIFTHVE